MGKSTKCRYLEEIKLIYRITTQARLYYTNNTFLAKNKKNDLGVHMIFLKRSHN